jgi:hypothetical protein
MITVGGVIPQNVEDTFIRPCETQDQRPRELEMTFA